MIEIRKVSKKFGDIQALDNLSFNVKKGEIFGLLGPNGAGKSTTINLINTYLSPDKGEILINGKTNRQADAQLKKLIGVIPQEIALYEDLTAQENLHFWGEIYQIPSKELTHRCLEMLKMVGLFERRRSKIKTFSGGMKRRINFAAGLLHNPQIILMDEPTVGVDPQSRNFIFEMIMELHRLGKTIIYTTHYLEEAEKLCQRIGIIDKGKLIAIGKKDELYRLLGNKESIIFKFSSEINSDKFKRFFPEFVITNESENTLKISGVNLKNKLAELLTLFNKISLEIIDLDFVKPNLEELFLKLTGRDLRE